MSSLSWPPASAPRPESDGLAAAVVFWALYLGVLAAAAYLACSS